jgi:hypothetical protein
MTVVDVEWLVKTTVDVLTMVVAVVAVVVVPPVVPFDACEDVEPEDPTVELLPEFGDTQTLATQFRPALHVPFEKQMHCSAPSVQSRCVPADGPHARAASVSIGAAIVTARAIPRDDLRRPPVSKCKRMPRSLRNSPTDNATRCPCTGAGVFVAAE